MFKIGDKVRTKHGKGKICHIKNEDVFLIGIEYPTRPNIPSYYGYLNFHTCDDHCPNERGRYYFEHEVISLEKRKITTKDLIL